jgi:hypothetical protein
MSKPSEEISLNFKIQEEETSFWIEVIFINHRIKAKVFKKDSFSVLTQRVYTTLLIDIILANVLAGRGTSVCTWTQASHRL